MGASFPQDFLESVRSAGDIVHLVSDYVPLKRAGTRLKGLCPFHQEKTPSFSVDPTAQLFYCFGCQTGGDIFAFVMAYEKVPFPEAVEMLAQRWGVPIPTTRRAGGDENGRLFEMNRTAAKFFRSLLTETESGRRCREYLEQRGIDPETSERLQVGFAPDAWESLGSHLRTKGFTPEEMLKGGLVSPRKSGSGNYDRFRNRLMFPIHDLNGRPIAFGGRTLGDDDAKYINSAETPVYKKGNHLYGLNLTREAIRREGFAIVVEGYLDLAALVQAGLDNVVASLGTAFTEAQARLLRRYTRRVVFSYDGDTAGAEATTRSLDLLLQHGLELRVAELEPGTDPDDHIRQHGAEAYGVIVQQAPHYLEFLIRREARDCDRIEQKIAAVNQVLPHVAKLGNAVERVYWADRLADGLQIEDGLVRQEVDRAVRDARPRMRRQIRDPREPLELREVEARLVHCLLNSEEERKRWKNELDLDDLEGTGIEPIVRAVFELMARGTTVDYPLVSAELEDEAERELLTRIAFRDEPEEGPGVEDCMLSLRRTRLTRAGRKVTREIGAIQQQTRTGPSSSDVDRQLRRLQELARQRDALT